ncbi:mitochondrial import inner membrane translocase subunit Tim54 [Dendryphion nanum]|uniref:Mitochondrial import inner membrane translocase subunit TIM54 n=1 Tax=Dendryphion nanum TaxID=256645 RepID=A0A9P9E4Y4_9PLEO|nr:mitochondrial import inner membrane translocase subunit Tim54 [Dendryphion nanum]
MAELDAKASPASGASAGPSRPPKPPNPVWRMMGLPNFRLKLPSRNWTIFLTITGSWTAAVMYDRRQKKNIQRKWAKLVEHIADETIYEHQLNRKLTIYISAPPADGLVTARDHFNEYVKPILVAAALDWDAVEGRREGDVRAELAEKIRKLRKLNGEQSVEPLEEDLEVLLGEMRKRSGVVEWDGIPGDIVIGRHTWKEYVRGLHEGWLGPLDPPQSTAENDAALIAETPATAQDSTPTAVADIPPVVVQETTTNPIAATPPADDASPTTVIQGEPETPTEEEKPKEEEKKPKKKKQPPPFNTTAEYHTSALSPNCPNALGPAAVIPMPHLLGFFNFPIRMYRFLNKRRVADDIGRETAAAVLAVFRPFDSPAEALEGSNDDARSQGEQQRMLAHEESDWHKNVRERKNDNGKERVWLDDMVLDSRIAGRMRRFELDSESEHQAQTIAAEKGEPWWQRVWPKKEVKKNLWEGLEEVD